jgi:hypothetical protein
MNQQPKSWAETIQGLRRMNDRLRGFKVGDLPEANRKKSIELCRQQIAITEAEHKQVPIEEIEEHSVVLALMWESLRMLRNLNPERYPRTTTPG